MIASDPICPKRESSVSLKPPEWSGALYREPPPWQHAIMTARWTIHARVFCCRSRRLPKPAPNAPWRLSRDDRSSDHCLRIDEARRAPRMARRWPGAFLTRAL
jgi:hypothetical protein